MRRIITVDEDEMRLRVWWANRESYYDDELYYTIFLKKGGKWEENKTVKVMP